jgi:two-component system, OmpR family, phosphate regulon sensor histidine kinase PhoR
MILILIIACAVAIVAVAAAVVSARRARAEGARADADTARARSLLEAETARRVAAFEVLPVAALRLDAGATIREINALAREKFPHVGVGQGILSSFGEHRFADEVAAALGDGAPRNFDQRLFADERRTYRVSVQPVVGTSERDALVFLIDFTDAVAYQELRSQFSANVSHELRTPLTGLAGLIEALGDPEMDSVTRVRFVDRAASEIQRLVALITDVLFLSELEATEWIAPAARTDARLAIDNAVEALGDVAAEHGVTVNVDADVPVWTPLTERMATTVVQNLVENAVKYGGPGSTTVIAARTVGEGRWAEIACTDNGPGIPERHLPHIFERFYRADASRSKRLGGTGLGLSIVKHIAERFGGVAEASSREGFGTTVTVRLPVPSADTPAVPAPETEDASPAPTR